MFLRDEKSTFLHAYILRHSEISQILTTRSALIMGYNWNTINDRESCTWLTDTRWGRTILASYAMLVMRIYAECETTTKKKKKKKRRSKNVHEKLKTKTWRANDDALHNPHTYRTSLWPSPSQTFELLHGTLQQNDCAASFFPLTLWPRVNSKVIQTSIFFFFLLPRSIWWLRWLDSFSRECRISGCQEQILCRPPELGFEGHTSGPYLLPCLLMEWAGL